MRETESERLARLFLESLSKGRTVNDACLAVTKAEGCTPFDVYRAFAVQRAESVARAPAPAHRKLGFGVFAPSRET